MALGLLSQTGESRKLIVRSRFLDKHESADIIKRIYRRHKCGCVKMYLVFHNEDLILCVLQSP